MNWKDIRTAPDGSGFECNGERLFGRRFDQVLKFHEPGIASVKDTSGSYHIDMNGNDLYSQRYIRTFGFYEGFAAVIDEKGWLHIDRGGNELYQERYRWLGNFQEGLCTAENSERRFIYLNSEGKDDGLGMFLYAGDFRDGIACVQEASGMYRHLTHVGKYLHGKLYAFLGVYHKGFAIARDEQGWFHIDMSGLPVYAHRFSYIEPFYNGIALAADLAGRWVRVSEDGRLHEL